MIFFLEKSETLTRMKEMREDESKCVGLLLNYSQDTAGGKKKIKDPSSHALCRPQVAVS